MWSGATGLYMYSTHIGQKGTVGGTRPGGHLIFRKVGTFMAPAAAPRAAMPRHKHHTDKAQTKPRKFNATLLPFI